ncbi:MAG: 30S ribosomal protein S5 [Rhodospirillaceae bacterium]|jgi:small subunit ribosomal protein S5|nr:30S ribosomal protein S5 [Rhodospirillaceae bacterium]
MVHILNTERGERSNRNNRSSNNRATRNNQTQNEESNFIDKLVHINRVSKVVKGGRRFAFVALVVVGDENGSVGYGSGKAREVPIAIRKASDRARRNMIHVILHEGRTIHHDVHGYFGAGHVILRSAPSGTGIIAGGSMRAIFETMGVQDVVAKCIGTSNPHNMIKATFNALINMFSPLAIASKRDKNVSEIICCRDDIV